MDMCVSSLIDEKSDRSDFNRLINYTKGGVEARV